MELSEKEKELATKVLTTPFDELNIFEKAFYQDLVGKLPDLAPEFKWMQERYIKDHDRNLMYREFQY